MRFEVGEIAVMALGVSDGPYIPRPGDEVEIVRVGSFDGSERVTGPAAPGYNGRSDRPADYEIRAADGHHWFARERYLRKRRPPIPESVRTIFTTHKAGQPA